jgi:hypothetical protein
MTESMNAVYHWLCLWPLLHESVPVLSRMSRVGWPGRALAQHVRVAADRSGSCTYAQHGLSLSVRRLCPAPAAISRMCAAGGGLYCHFRLRHHGETRLVPDAAEVVLSSRYYQ